MRPLLLLFLNTIGLILFIAAVPGTCQNTTNATRSTPWMTPTIPVPISNNASEEAPKTTMSKTVNLTTKDPKGLTSAQTSKLPTTKTNKPFMTTKRSQTESKPAKASVVVVLFFILLLLILLVILYRWYKNNPDRRSCRGLWDSIVETAQCVWAAAMALLQHSQKQPEQAEDEDEDEDEEENEEAVVVEMEIQERDGGQKTERNGNKEEEGVRKNEDDTSSDSETSSEDYSFVEGGNVADDEKQNDEDEASEKSNKEETEEMTSVKLDDEEEAEKAEPEESDDLTPL